MGVGLSWDNALEGERRGRVWKVILGCGWGVELAGESRCGCGEKQAVLDNRMAA